jgi:hypothetical protein
MDINDMNKYFVVTRCDKKQCKPFYIEVKCGISDDDIILSIPKTDNSREIKMCNLKREYNIELQQYMLDNYERKPTNKYLTTYYKSENNNTITFERQYFNLYILTFESTYQPTIKLFGKLFNCWSDFSSESKENYLPSVSICSSPQTLQVKMEMYQFEFVKNIIEIFKLIE